MKGILAIVAAALLVCDAEAGFLDRLKDRTRDAVRKTVQEEVDSATRDHLPPKQEEKKSPVNDEEVQEKGTEESAYHETAETPAETLAVPTGSELYGHWKGIVVETGKTGQRTTLEVLISPEVNSLRVSGLSTRCLAELQPLDATARYRARFLDENAPCGENAILTFTGGNNVRVEWADYPGLNLTQAVSEGELKRLMQPYPLRWSASQQHRDAFDVVGFTLGMTYEDTRDFREKRHPDLAAKLHFVRDAGTISIVNELAESGARKLGSSVRGEQLTLIFESETPEQRKVEQTPETLAKIAEREKLLKEREALRKQQRNERGTSRRGRGRAARMGRLDSELPEIPPKPELRPAGADAELLVISRQIHFAKNAAPHKDNVIAAMSEKYGTPSVRVEKLGSNGGQILLGWTFDKDDQRIEDANGSLCDHLSRNTRETKKIAKLYAVALTANRYSDVYDLVSMSPECGLTAKAQLRVMADGSLYRMTTTVYDAQRLLHDEWYRIVEFKKALIAEREDRQKQLEKRAVPDF